jgi:hypothetical protein
MADVLQLEGFGSDIINSTSIIFCESGPNFELWLPYEFFSSEPVTRILLIGEHSSGTRGLVASEKWTMILDMTSVSGAKNWSILASIVKHLIGPVMIVVAPDVAIPAALGQHMSNNITLIVYKWLSEIDNFVFNASTVFFPISVQSGHIVSVQRAIWRGMALRTSDTNLGAIIQETRPQGLCLVSSVLDGGVVSLAWYRTKDSNDMVKTGRQDFLSAWLSAISDRVVKLLKK